MSQSRPWAAILYAYYKNGKFDNLVDTFHSDVEGNKAHLLLGNRISLQTMVFDWKLELQQSGKVYEIRDIQFIKHKEKLYDQGDYCYNSVSLYCNDKRVVLQAKGSFRYIELDYLSLINTTD